MKQWLSLGTPNISKRVIKCNLMYFLFGTRGPRGFCRLEYHCLRKYTTFFQMYFSFSFSTIVLRFSIVRMNNYSRLHVEIKQKLCDVGLLIYLPTIVISFALTRVKQMYDH